MEQKNPSLHPEFQGDPAEPHDGHGSKKRKVREKRNHTKRSQTLEKVTDTSPLYMYQHKVKQVNTMNVTRGSYFSSSPVKTGSEHCISRCVYHLYKNIHQNITFLLSDAKPELDLHWSKLLKTALWVKLRNYDWSTSAILC